MKHPATKLRQTGSDRQKVYTLKFKKHKSFQLLKLLCYLKNKFYTNIYELHNLNHRKLSLSSLTQAIKCTMIYLHTYISLLKYGFSGQPHVKLLHLTWLRIPFEASSRQFP